MVRRLQQLLLQPYEELKRKGVADETEGTAASKPKRNIGKLRVQGKEDARITYILLSNPYVVVLNCRNH